MGLFDIGPANESSEVGGSLKVANYQRRTFEQTIQDQIANHKAKIEELQAVLDSMTPEVAKFVEAIQKARL